MTWQTMVFPTENIRILLLTVPLKIQRTKTANTFWEKIFHLSFRMFPLSLAHGQLNQQDKLLEG